MSFNYEYPRPMVTVDALVFAGKEDDLSVLLIQRGNPPFQGKWALPGGFVEMDETLAVGRELEEETGLVLSDFQQLHTFGKPGRDPRGRNITIVFIKHIPNVLPVTGGDDAAMAEWFEISAIPELAFDHNKVIRKGLEVLGMQ